jgi:hypothetical protein
MVLLTIILRTGLTNVNLSYKLLIQFCASLETDKKAHKLLHAYHNAVQPRLVIGRSPHRVSCVESFYDQIPFLAPAVTQ